MTRGLNLLTLAAETDPRAVRATGVRTGGRSRQLCVFHLTGIIDGLRDQLKAGRRETDEPSLYDRPQENYLTSSSETSLQDLASAANGMSPESHNISIHLFQHI